MARALIHMPATARRGDIIEIRALIGHPMETGYRVGADGKLIEQGRISKILAFRGIERTPLDEAEAGDIVAIAGLTKGTVADTFCDPSVDTPLQAQPIDPPTVSMSFIVNNSPLAGTEGDKVTSRMIRDRLLREAEGNVALRVVEAADKDSMEVSGRGELQLAILIETMRREGFELSVSRPRVVLQKDEAGVWQEPIEEVVIDVDEEHSGVVVQKMSERKAEMIEMRRQHHDLLGELGVALDQRIVDVLVHRGGRAFVLRMRIEGEGVSLAGPAQGFGLDGRGQAKGGDSQRGDTSNEHGHCRLQLLCSDPNAGLRA